MSLLGLNADFHFKVFLFFIFVGFSNQANHQDSGYEIEQTESKKCKAKTQNSTTIRRYAYWAIILVQFYWLNAHIIIEETSKLAR